MQCLQALSNKIALYNTLDLDLAIATLSREGHQEPFQQDRQRALSFLRLQVASNSS